MKNVFKIKLVRQHLGLEQGTIIELELGVAHELIKRGVAEVDQADKARYVEFAGVAERPNEDLILKRKAFAKAYEERASTERIRESANDTEITGRLVKKLGHVQCPI